MDKFVVKGNEWHYRLLKRFDKRDWSIQYDYNNFCSYWRAVCLRILLCLTIALFLLVWIFFLIYAPIYALVLHPFYGYVSELADFWFALTLIDGIALFTALIFFLWRTYDWGSKLAGFIENTFWNIEQRRRARREYREENPSIFRQWLRTLRDKTCVMIEYENKE